MSRQQQHSISYARQADKVTNQDFIKILEDGQAADVSKMCIRDRANIELGINYVQEIGVSVPVDDRVKIKARSTMGTEIPLVQHEARPLRCV